VTQNSKGQLAEGRLDPCVGPDVPCCKADAANQYRHTTRKRDRHMPLLIRRTPRCNPIDQHVDVVERFARHSLACQESFCIPASQWAKNCRSDSAAPRCPGVRQRDQSRTFFVSSLPRPPSFGKHRPPFGSVSTGPQMLPIWRHFGNALQPRNRPPALGPFFASRSTRGLPHRGQVREAMGCVTARGGAGGGVGGTGRGTAGGALAGDEAMTTR
jgi:hypothetical protein